MDKLISAEASITSVTEDTILFGVRNFLDGEMIATDLTIDALFSNPDFRVVSNMYPLTTDLKAFPQMSSPAARSVMDAYRAAEKKYSKLYQEAGMATRERYNDLQKEIATQRHAVAVHRMAAWVAFVNVFGFSPEDLKL